MKAFLLISLNISFLGWALCSLREKAQTQNLNIYNISEVQTQTYICFSHA